MIWDYTCGDTLADSYSSFASRSTGAVAEEAEIMKHRHYADLDDRFIFIAIFSLGFT